MTFIVKIILIAFGFFNALFLTYKDLSSAKGCIIGQGCDSVTTSVYASFLGLPVALYGVIYFTMLFYAIFQNQDKLLWKYLLHVLLISGLIISVVLMVLQFFVIKAFCIYCTFSATIITVINIITFMKLGDKNEVN